MIEQLDVWHNATLTAKLLFLVLLYSFKILSLYLLSVSCSFFFVFLIILCFLNLQLRVVCQGIAQANISVFAFPSLLSSLTSDTNRHATLMLYNTLETILRLLHKTGKCLFHNKSLSNARPCNSHCPYMARDNKNRNSNWINAKIRAKLN